MMASRVGKRVDAGGRDTGNTTGVATAVLALLSAGTLATLGLVTTSDLRSPAPLSPGAGAAAVAPPSTLVFPGQPTAPSRPHKGGSSGGGSSGFPIQPPAPIQPTVQVPGPVPSGAAPAPSAAGPGLPSGEAPVVPPTPTAGPQPVLTGVTPPTVVVPEPEPEVSVLAVKQHKPHPDTPRGRARRPQPPPNPAAPPWSAAVAGPHGRPRATTAHPRSVPTPTPTPSATPLIEPDTAHGKGHEQHQDKGHAPRGHDHALPATPTPSPSPDQRRGRDDAKADHGKASRPTARPHERQSENRGDATPPKPHAQDQGRAVGHRAH